MRDFKKLDMPERDLKEILADIERLKLEQQAVLKSRRREDLEIAHNLVSLHGFTAIEIGAPARTPRRKVNVKYQFCDKIWCGRGRRPKWVKELIAKGWTPWELAENVLKLAKES